MSFVHLRSHSAYSLLKGAIKIPKLVALARADGMPAIGIADHDNLFGSLEFSEAALKEGVQPIIGMTVSLVPLGQERLGNGTQRIVPDQMQLYARDEAGYANLIALASKAHTAPALGIAPLLNYTMLAEHAKGIIALTGGLGGGFGRALLANRTADADALLANLHDNFGDRLYIELTRHDMPEERQIERAQIDAALTRSIPLVATNNIYFPDASYLEAHDALMCVADGRYVTEADRPKMNAEHRFKTTAEMKLRFGDLPEAIENTLNIARRCHVWAPSR
jgi:DNA polymerase-3 subunit alpha